MNKYPWEGDTYRCDLLQILECGRALTEEEPLDDVDRWPGARSFYGVELLFGGVIQWVSDWATVDYADPGSRIDPIGPPTGTDKNERGTTAGSGIASVATYYFGRRVPTESPYTILGARCARSVMPPASTTTMGSP